MLLIACAFALEGCGAGYLLQAARGQWQVLRQRQDISKAIASDSTDAALRLRLELVKDARDFASDVLALPDNRSYRTYSVLGRPYVVWNVVAAPEFSVEPKRWCFPITGCITYRGYFREANAQRYAMTLRQQGYDVLVAGVAAYSTLGRFADPVLDTMMRYGDLELVGTLFHELAHQVVYVKDDSEFNESFAMTVEQEGLTRWLAARGRSAEVDAYQQRRARQQVLSGMLAEGRTQLAQLYRQPLAADEKRQSKRALLDALGMRMQEYQRGQGIRSGYDAWIAAGLNNAHLASVGTYHDCIPGFRQLLAQQGNDLPAFYDAVKRLADDAAGRRRLCAAG